MKISLIILILCFAFAFIKESQAAKTSAIVLANTEDLSEYDTEDQAADDQGVLDDQEIQDDQEDQDDEEDETAVPKTIKEQTIKPVEETKEADGLTKAQKEKLRAEQIKDEVLSEIKKSKAKEALKTNYDKPRHDWKFKDPSKHKNTPSAP